MSAADMRLQGFVQVLQVQIMCFQRGFLLGVMPVDQVEFIGKAGQTAIEMLQLVEDLQ